MQIMLTEEECIDIFYSALCNTTDTSWIEGYGLELDWDEDEYKTAKNRLLKEKKNPCREDVWIQILRYNGVLRIVDHEGDGDYTRTITMKEVIERVPKTPIKHLTDMVEGNDDIITADIVLQTVFFEDIIFG